LVLTSYKIRILGHFSLFYFRNLGIIGIQITNIVLVKKQDAKSYFTTLINYGYVTKLAIAERLAARIMQKFVDYPPDKDQIKL
jgi:hypothetical protein